jgi:hypothetical protein
MWDNLTPADIEQAKRDLNLRRAATLSRHAEEISSLEVEQSEIDEVGRVVAAFAEKFMKKDSTSSIEPGTIEEEESTEAEHDSDEKGASGSVHVVYASPNFARQYSAA